MCKLTTTKTIEFGKFNPWFSSCTSCYKCSSPIVDNSLIRELMKSTMTSFPFPKLPALQVLIAAALCGMRHTQGIGWTSPSLGLKICTACLQMAIGNIASFDLPFHRTDHQYQRPSCDPLHHQVLGCALLFALGWVPYKARKTHKKNNNGWDTVGTRL